MKKLLIALSVLALAGCSNTGSLKGKLDNRVVCTVARDKAFVVSEYGPIGMASTLADADKAVICPALAPATVGK